MTKNYNVGNYNKPSFISIVVDPAFKKELESRLKLINPNREILVNCCVCRKNFVARMIEFSLQETCISCINKKLIAI